MPNASNGNGCCLENQETSPPRWRRFKYELPSDAIIKWCTAAFIILGIILAVAIIVAVPVVLILLSNGFFGADALSFAINTLGAGDPEGDGVAMIASAICVLGPILSMILCPVLGLLTGYALIGLAKAGIWLANQAITIAEKLVDSFKFCQDNVIKWQFTGKKDSSKYCNVESSSNIIGQPLSDTGLDGFIETQARDKVKKNSYCCCGWAVGLFNRFNKQKVNNAVYTEEPFQGQKLLNSI